MATIDLTNRSLRDQNDVLGRLALSEVGVISPDPNSTVIADVYDGVLRISVNGFNVFFVNSPQVIVNVSSKKPESGNV